MEKTLYSPKRTSEVYAVMTLLIALLLMYHMGISPAWIIPVFILWIIHVCLK